MTELNKVQLEGLIERLKQAKAGSRELDADTLCLVAPDKWRKDSRLPDGCLWGWRLGKEVVFWPGQEGGRNFPSPTGSLDAALAFSAGVNCDPHAILLYAADDCYDHSLDGVAYVQHLARFICIHTLTALKETRDDG